jgi:hypothetical protein
MLTCKACLPVMFLQSLEEAGVPFNTEEFYFAGKWWPTGQLAGQISCLE